jgi:catechol 2,3-dioxygenase-like lactoylglutathione lyase family enzyme
VGPTTQLHLMVMNESIPETMRHMAIEVEDFDATIQALKGEGISIIDGPGKRVDGSDYLFCNDPDGNLIEIVKH